MYDKLAMQLQVKKIVTTIGIPMLSAVIGAATFAYLTKAPKNKEVFAERIAPISSVSLAGAPADFVKASAVSTPSVVFIKTESTVQYNSGLGWFWDFDPFGSKGKSTGSGSGVIVSKDGYIVTNNHVIDGADKISVVLNDNKTEFIAKVIGKDASSDLALLKIEASDLPTMAFGNSDLMNVGDWVIAVGNPFNLTSTVTAGIVSAKGRNINVGNKQFPIESFIQTDAAINPGNSGGALVNLSGELVGINTAIQSNTGSYTGYGFAIPSNIVSKIVKDFIQSGEIKRAYAGMTVDDLSAAKQKELGKSIKGVIVTDLIAEGPAEKEGIQVNDIITQIGDKQISSKAQFDELMAYLRPDDEMKIYYLRAGKENSVTLKMVSKTENNALLQKGAVTSKQLGAAFQPLSKTDLAKYKITNGIRVLNLVPYNYVQQSGLDEGFIITSFNGEAYDSAEDLIAAMEGSLNSWKIEGMDKFGRKKSMRLSFY